jgi:hypothetical protein
MATRPSGSDSGFHTEVVGWRGLSDAREAWKVLTCRTIEPNVFYDPDFALPVIEALGFSDAIRAFLVWRDTKAGERVLAGLFPFIVSRRWGVPVTSGEAFIHPYAMSSAPLVDAEWTSETLSAFFVWLDQGSDAPAAWLFRFLPQDGPLYAALTDQATRASARVGLFGAYERAVLDGESLDAGQSEAALSTKRRREYRRLRRKLAEHGTVSVTRATTPDTDKSAMAEFLALEASGWKGRRGTAAAMAPSTRQMFEEIAEGLSASGQIRIDALRVDGAPVAMAMSCGVGNRWWLWKISFDEAFARYSPGVLAVLDVSEMAVRDGDHYDSCALPGIPMIERAWRQRRPYADMLIAPARLRRTRQAAVVSLEGLRRQAETTARRARDLIRKK